MKCLEWDPPKILTKLGPLFRRHGTRLIEGNLRSRHEWISHTGERGSQAFDPHYHLLQRSGCVRFPDRLLSETPFSALSGFSISRCAAVEADVPSGRLGAGRDASASRGGPGGVSTAYSTLAAAETVPGRGPITQCRLLLGGKQT